MKFYRLEKVRKVVVKEEFHACKSLFFDFKMN
jgi:hypothetical protein